MKIISWNIARRDDAWRELLNMDADIALLQEATQPPPDVADKVIIDPAPWITVGAGKNRQWKSAIVDLSQKSKIKWLESKPLENAMPKELGVSRLGTLNAAEVTSADGATFILVSMYAAWENPHAITQSSWIYADASAHRLISDLSALIGQQTKHKIIAAGDLNILYGYGDHGKEYWGARYSTVFTRLESLGLSFVGPQSPNGRMAEPWPDELPQASKNVPTYYTSRQSPSSATRQLDFVFASNSLKENIKVRAINEPENWGPSDHCRVEIIVK